MPSWDLEYMLLFGPPENKLELLDGKTPCSFPFADRGTADAHFELWGRTLARCLGIADPPAGTMDAALVKNLGGFVLKQYRRPIRLEVPSTGTLHEWAYSAFWDRSLWPMQPAGFETGFEWPQDHWDIKVNLWSVFQDAKKGLGFEGDGIGGVDISLTENDAVQPDFFFFPGPRKRNLIADSYFKGVPPFIAEVLSPFSRALDRGPRKEVYRKAGVGELWLIEPLTQTIEMYRLIGTEYRLESVAHSGDSLPVRAIAGMTVDTERLFRTQSSRFKDFMPDDGTSRPRLDWGIPRDQPVSLGHLILLGHAERRREIWNNQSPCFLAFASVEEARHRLGQFLLEAARWESVPAPAPVTIEPEIEAADVGRFRFVRRGHIVHLNVDVSGWLYRALLEVSANHDAWDWGDK